MTESVTVARQYAQAVLEIARESASLDAWSERLQHLASISEDSEISKILGNPVLSFRQIVDAVVSIAGESGNKEFTSFVGVLLENERFDMTPQIREVYEQLRDTDEGVKEVIIYSAFPLDKSQLDKLLEQFESHFGSKLKPRVEIDASLIGGVKVVVGDHALDVSVRGKLDAMAAALKKN